MLGVILGKNVDENEVNEAAKVGQRFPYPGREKRATRKGNSKEYKVS